MKWHEDENEELGIGENTFREECRGLSGVITWVIAHLPPPLTHGQELKLIVVLPSLSFWVKNLPVPKKKKGRM